MPTAIDYAWAAGIIDGEGCIFIGRHKAGGSNGAKTDCYFVAIKVTMGHEPTIVRLKEMFNFGSNHRIEQRGFNPAFTWLAQASNCKTVLDFVQPYLFTKAEEAAVAREFLALPPWRNGRCRGIKSHEHQQREYEIWDRMRRLKPRTRLHLEGGVPCH